MKAACSFFTMQFNLIKKDLVLTSSEVIKLLAGITRAKACAFRCRGIEEWGPCRVQHDHLLQLGVIIHGGVGSSGGRRSAEQAGASLSWLQPSLWSVLGEERSVLERSAANPSGMINVKMLRCQSLLLSVDLLTLTVCLLVVFPLLRFLIVQRCRTNPLRLRLNA